MLPVWAATVVVRAPVVRFSSTIDAASTVKAIFVPSGETIGSASSDGSSVSCGDRAAAQIEAVDAVAAGGAAVGGEDDRAAVGGEVRFAVIVAAGAELAEVVAVSIDDPEVEVAVAVGLEDDPAAVGGPARAGGVLEIVGEAAGDATGGGGYPDRGDEVERQPPAVGGDGDHEVGAFGQDRLIGAVVDRRTGCCGGGGHCAYCSHASAELECSAARDAPGAGVGGVLVNHGRSNPSGANRPAGPEGTLSTLPASSVRNDPDRRVAAAPVSRSGGVRGLELSDRRSPGRASASGSRRRRRARSRRWSPAVRSGCRRGRLGLALPRRRRRPCP